MRMMGQDCICGRPPFPDCFGCLVLELDIPQAWQLDFPAAMEYSGYPGGECTEITEATVWNNFRHRKYHWYEYPDLGTFGIGTILELDDAPLIDVYGPYVQCIWASSDEWWLYESTREINAGTFYTGCDATGVPTATRGTDTQGANGWVYRTASNVAIPAGKSPNRQRTLFSATNPLCNTNPDPGCPVGRSQIACDVSPFGILGILLVRSNVATGEFWIRVDVHWIPRVFYQIESWRGITFPAPSTWPGGFRYLEGSSRYGYIPASVPLPATGTQFPLCAYPLASNLANLQAAGLILRYEKQVDCDTDFDGTPVTLPKILEAKASASATQTLCAAHGITSIPASITVTPL